MLGRCNYSVESVVAVAAVGRCDDVDSVSVRAVIVSCEILHMLHNPNDCFDNNVASEASFPVFMCRLSHVIVINSPFFNSATSYVSSHINIICVSLALALALSVFCYRSYPSVSRVSVEKLISRR